MKWIVNGEEHTEFFTAVNAVINEIHESEFDNYLNNTYGNINICDLEYSAADVLADVDPIAYRDKLIVWLTMIHDEVEGDLDAMCYGDKVIMYGVYVDCVEEDDEEEDAEDDE